MQFEVGDLVRLIKPIWTTVGDDRDKGNYSDIHSKLFHSGQILKVTKVPGVTPDVVYVQLPEHLLTPEFGPYIGLRNWELELVYQGM